MKKIYTLLLSILCLLSAQAQVTVTGAVTGNGTYTTLNAAFIAIGTSQAGANIVVNLTANATEPAAGASLGAGTWTSLVINMGSFKDSGSIAGAPLIIFNGADNVTVNGGTFINSSTATTTGTTTLKLAADATYNNFVGVTIKSAAQTTTTSNGGCVWLSTATATGNDFNTFTNCTFTAVNPALTTIPCQKGVVDAPTGTTSLNTLNNNITFEGCNFVDIWAASTSSYGIYSTSPIRWKVNNCRYYHTVSPRTQTTTATHYGFTLTSTLNDSLTFTNNIIGGNDANGNGTMTFRSTGTTAVPTFYGYNHGLGNAKTNALFTTYSSVHRVENNKVTNITMHVMGTAVGSSALNPFYGSTSAATTAAGTMAGTLHFNNNEISNLKWIRSSATNYMAYYTGYYLPYTNMNNNLTNNITMDSGATASFYGLGYVSSYYDSVKIFNNNTVKNFTRTALAGNSGTTYLLSPYYGYGKVDVKNNLIDSINILPNAFTGTTYGLYVYNYGINTASDVSNNIIRNINNRSRGAHITAGMYIYGTYTPSFPLGQTYAVNNQIYNILGNDSLISAGSIYGFTPQTYGNISFKNNQIYNLKYARNVRGIYSTIGTSGGQNDTFANNLIYGLTTNDTLSRIIGVELNGAAVHVLQNNMITDITYPTARNVTSTNQPCIMGIHINTAGTHKLYHNTVSMGTASSPLTTSYAGSATTRFGGAAFSYVIGNSALDVRNNIFNINGIPTGHLAGAGNSQTFAAIKSVNASTGSASMTTTTANYTFSNNILNVNDHINNYLICEGITDTPVNAVTKNSGTTNLNPARNRTQDLSFNTSCSLYKSSGVGAILGANSFWEDNLTTVGSNIVAPSGLSFAESGGTTVNVPASALAADYNNTSRTSPPDIGAIEFTGTASDASGPSYSYTNIPTQNCTNKTPTLEVTISDPSSIDATTGAIAGSAYGNAPRLYYKRANDVSNAVNTAGTNYGVSTSSAITGWKFVESQSTGSPFSFSLDYGLLDSTPVAGESIQYFLAASDLVSGTPNVSTNGATLIGSGICLSNVDIGSASGLTGATSSKSYAISPPATVFMRSAPTGNICAGNNDTLSMAVGVPGYSALATAGLTNTTATAHPTLFDNYWYSTWDQSIVSAAEMKAAGLVSGKITKLKFRTSGNASVAPQYYAIRIGATTKSAYASASSAEFVTTGLKMLDSFGTVTMSLNPEFVFANNDSFVWDGLSNVIVDIRQYGHYGSQNAITECVNTPLNQHLYAYSSTSGTSWITPTTTSMFAKRPNMQFYGIVGSPMASYNWTESGSTVATTNPAIVQPGFPGGATTMTYSVLATDASGCTFNGTIDANKNTTTPSIINNTINNNTPCFGDSLQITNVVTDGCVPYQYAYSFTPTSGTPYAVVLSNTGKFFPTISGTLTLTVTDNASQTVSLPYTSITMTGIPTATNQTRCGTGTVTFAATPASASDSVIWYPTLTSKSPLSIGANYTTAILNQNPSAPVVTTYYVCDYNPLPGVADQKLGVTTGNTYTTPLPFYYYYAGQKLQYMIKSSELNLMGLAKGDITQLKMNVPIATAAGAAGAQGFTMSMSSVPITDTFMTTTFRSGLSTVYTVAAQQLTAGMNTFNFSTPYYWDGVSNMIIDMSWGNNYASGTTPYWNSTVASGTLYTGIDYTYPVFNNSTAANNASCTYQYASTASTAATMFAMTSGFVSYYRPVMWFTGTKKCEGPRIPVTATVTPAPTFYTVADMTVCNNTAQMLEVTQGKADYTTFNWSQPTNLFSDAACTTPYSFVGFDSAVYYKNLSGVTENLIITADNPTSGCSVKDTIKVTNLPNPVYKFAPSSICYAGNGSISLNPSTNMGTSAIVWKKSPTGLAGSYTTMSVASDATSVTDYLDSTTYYTTEFSVGGTACANTTSGSLVVNKPGITAVMPATRCGYGTVDLTANAPAGSNIDWYADQTGGVKLGTGTTFTTPNISATTVYWAQGSNSSSSEGGWSSVYGTPTYYSYTTGYGTEFSCGVETTIDSVAVYPALSTSGTVNYTIYNYAAPSASGTLNNPLGTVATGSFTVPIGSTGTPMRVMVPINKTLGPGYYKIIPTTTSLWYNYISSLTPYSYPFQIGSSFQVLLGATSSTYSYNYYSGSFYDFKITEKCGSARISDTAFVTAPPAITLTTSPDTICQLSSSTLGVTSSNSGYSYTWANGVGTGTGITVSPMSNTTYYVTAEDNTIGSPNQGCVTTGSKSIVVMSTPSPIVFNKQNDTVGCPVSVVKKEIVSGGTVGGSFNVGAFSAYELSNTATSNPYYVWYNNHTHQYMYRASELLAAGMQAGNINSLAFKVQSKAVVSGSSLMLKFKISLGSVPHVGIDTAMTAAYKAPSNMTLVYSKDTIDITVAPDTGFNTYTFSAPFYWDGVSNLILQTCHLNNGIGYDYNPTVYINTTTWPSVSRSNSDATGLTSANECTNFSTISNISIRPDVRFNSSTPTTFRWYETTPGVTPPNIKLDSPFTVAYSGNPKKVWAKKTSSFTYYTESKTAFGCKTMDSNKYVVLQGSATISLPPTTVTGGTISCTPIGSGSWTYYGNPSYPMCFAINKNNSGMTGETVEVEVLSTNPTSYYAGQGANQEHGSYFMQRSWDVNGTVPTGSVDVRFYYDSVDSANCVTLRDDAYTILTTSTNTSTLAVKTPFHWFKSVGAPYNAAWRASVVGNKFPSTHVKLTPNYGTQDGIRYVEFTGITSFSGGSGGAGFGAPGSGGGVGLPVTWAEFTATAKENGNNLIWKTASEKNTSHFEVEYSLDNVSFTKASNKILAAGNSTDLRTYTFTHPNVTDNFVYYRIKQVDLDGQFDYSVVRVVKRSVQATFTVNAFPIPVKSDNIVNVKLTSIDKSKVSIKMTDMTGKVTYTKSVTPTSDSHTEKVDMSSLSSGIYFIEVQNGQGKQILRVIK